MIAEEHRRVRRLQRLVDFTLAMIAQSDLTLDEAQRAVAAVRRYAYRLFPDKKDAFN